MKALLHLTSDRQILLPYKRSHELPSFLQMPLRNGGMLRGQDGRHGHTHIYRCLPSPYKIWTCSHALQKILDFLSFLHFTHGYKSCTICLQDKDDERSA